MSKAKIPSINFSVTTRKLFQHYKYNKFIKCPDETVVTENRLTNDHYFLSHLSPVKPRRTIKLQPINHAANKQSTNR